MFALFSGLYESYLVPEPLTILMVGLDNSGKTVLLESLKQSFNSTSVLMRADQIKPTIGVNCAKITIRGTAVSIYDAAGSLRSRPLWNHYYGDCDGNIFVLDSAGIERQEEMALVYGAVVAAVNNAQKRGKKKGGKGYAARKGSIPIGVFSNKEDLAGEKVSPEHKRCASYMCKQRGWRRVLRRLRNVGAFWRVSQSSLTRSGGTRRVVPLPCASRPFLSP